MLITLHITPPWLPQHPYLGTFSFGRPVLVVNDLDATRRVLISDFDHFADRRHVDFHQDTEASKIMGRMLTVLTGDRWKRVRSALSPAFTSGKLKAMMPLINKVETKDDSFTASVDF